MGHHCRFRRCSFWRFVVIGYMGNIKALTEENTDFRHVFYSGSKLQLVLMSVEPGEELAGEIHADTDQFFGTERGKGRIMIHGSTRKVKAGDGVIDPAGAHHNVICTGHDALKLYTIYGPPHHSDQLVQKTRAEADASDEAFDGQATEQAAKVVLA